MRSAIVLVVAAACAPALPPAAEPASPAATRTKASDAAPRAVVRTAGSGLQGYWRGALIRDNALLEMSILVTGEGATPKLLVDVPDWGTVALPRAATFDDNRLVFELGGGEIRLEVDTAAGVMRGEMAPVGAPALRDEDGERLVAIELVRRPDPGQPRLVRRETEFASADGVSLAGTVVLPPGPGPFPGVVIVQGRGYGGRGVFLGLAARAARRGIAALVFDGRGHGGSGGTRGTHTLQHRWDDAHAALRTLRAVPEVDATAVGLFGHSAGGWVVPVVAQQDGGVAFVVLSAGPAVDLAVQQAQVVRELLDRSGREFSETERQAAYDYQETLTRLAMRGEPWPTIEAHVATATGQRWADIADTPSDYTDDTSVGYFRRVPHDSDEALASLTVPVLALYGADDWIVPASDNVAALERALRRAGNRDFEIVVFPRANHGLEVPGSDGADGAPFSWSRHPPELFDTLFGFITRVTSGQEPGR